MTRDRLKEVVIGGGKNQFLPFSKGFNPELTGQVIGSGKNQFLPLSKRLETGLRREVMGSGKNQFLPLEILGSYGEWQEPVLATFKASRDRAET